MYLHVGQDISVDEALVIGIFDIDNTTTSRITRDFVRRLQYGSQVINVSEELPKSYVVCSGDDGVTVYISQLSSQTLARRAGLFEKK